MESPSGTETEARREAPLEAVRGLAALSVVGWHLMLGFFPSVSGIFRGGDGAGIVDRFWFAPLNGTGAVGIFFVLSGFVLTRRALAEGNVTRILRGAVKRWPRLAGPVLLAVLLSWSLFHFGAYSFVEAGTVTGSPWLRQFAYAGEHPLDDRTLPGAVAQGLYATFFLGHASYDTSLWTMRYEFLGSFMAFALALCLIWLGGWSGVARALVAIVAACAAANYVNGWYFSLLTGVALAVLLPADRFSLSPIVAAAAFILAFYLLGYLRGATDYAWLGPFIGYEAGEPYIYAVAAVLLILVVEASPAMRRSLSAPWALMLGRLSFPVYLVHILVLCSFGCAVFLKARLVLSDGWAGAIACLATILGTLLLAAPFAMFDVWWTRRISAFGAWLLPGALRIGKSAPVRTAP